MAEFWSEVELVSSALYGDEKPSNNCVELEDVCKPMGR